jgi:hypothetical protein
MAIASWYPASRCRRRSRTARRSPLRFHLVARRRTRFAAQVRSRKESGRVRISWPKSVVARIADIQGPSGPSRVNSSLRAGECSTSALPSTADNQRGEGTSGSCQKADIADRHFSDPFASRILASSSKCFRGARRDGAISRRCSNGFL